MAGGRENIEGLQLTTSATLPLTGVAGPAIDAEYIINPETGQSAGTSLGIGVAAFPNASVSLGANFITLSARDTLSAWGVNEPPAADPVYAPAEDATYALWFDHLAL